MTDVFGWTAVAVTVFAVLTFGVSVAPNYQRAAIIQGVLAAAFLGVFLALTYFPPSLPPNPS